MARFAVPFLRFKSINSTISRSQIEYLGFGTYVLAESRILLPSVPEMGTVRWNQRLYGFYSTEAAEFFISKPEK